MAEVVVVDARESESFKLERHAGRRRRTCWGRCRRSGPPVIIVEAVAWPSLRRLKSSSSAATCAVGGPRVRDHDTVMAKPLSISRQCICSTTGGCSRRSRPRHSPCLGFAAGYSGHVRGRRVGKGAAQRCGPQWGLWPPSAAERVLLSARLSAATICDDAVVKSTTAGRLR